MTDLYCASCNTHMATLRDAKVRSDVGMVVYCAPCAERLQRKPEPVEMPEAFKKIFGGK